MTTEKTTFHKKVYSKLDRSPFSRDVGKRALKQGTSKGKKIVPTSSISGLREQFKKSFLPLLIEIFELRQMIANHKAESEGSPLPLGKLGRSPEEILRDLKAKQEEVEEAQRWMSGVISQISKGIEETKAMMESADFSGNESALTKLRDWMEQ